MGGGKNQRNDKRAQKSALPADKVEPAEDAAANSESDEELSDTSNNPYIVAIEKRSRALRKRVRKAEETEERLKTEKSSLQPNQKQQLEEKHSCAFSAKEFDAMIPVFREIQSVVRQQQNAEIDADMSAVAAILLLPAYLDSDSTGRRRASLLDKTPSLTAEQLDLLLQVKDILYPSTVETSLKEAITQRTTFLHNLISGSSKMSQLGVPFAELKTIVDLVLNSPAAETVPAADKPPKEERKKPQQQKKNQKAPKKEETPAKPEPKEETAPAEEKKEEPAPSEPTSAPAPAAAAAPAPAKPESGKKQPRNKNRKQDSTPNPHVYKPGAATVEPNATAAAPKTDSEAPKAPAQAAPKDSPYVWKPSH